MPTITELNKLLISNSSHCVSDPSTGDPSMNCRLLNYSNKCDGPKDRPILNMFAGFSHVHTNWREAEWDQETRLSEPYKIIWTLTI